MPFPPPPPPLSLRVLAGSVLWHRSGCSLGSSCCFHCCISLNTCSTDTEGSGGRGRSIAGASNILLAVCPSVADMYSQRISQCGFHPLPDFGTNTSCKSPACSTSVFAKQALHLRWRVWSGPSRCFWVQRLFLGTPNGTDFSLLVTGVCRPQRVQALPCFHTAAPCCLARCLA